MSPQPLLIVNGDDFGRTESSTQGVMQTFQRGILTSTSIVASSRCFDQAVGLATLARSNPSPRLSSRESRNSWRTRGSPTTITRTPSDTIGGAIWRR